MNMESSRVGSGVASWRWSLWVLLGLLPWFGGCSTQKVTVRWYVGEKCNPHPFREENSRLKVWICEISPLGTTEADFDSLKLPADHAPPGTKQPIDMERKGVTFLQEVTLSTNARDSGGTPNYTIVEVAKDSTCLGILGFFQQPETGNAGKKSKRRLWLKIEGGVVRFAVDSAGTALTDMIPESSAAPEPKREQPASTSGAASPPAGE